MSKLYEISAAIAGWEPEVDENGEVLNFEALEALEMERGEKIENIACFIKNLTTDAKDLRDEEKVLAERRRVIENKIERIKNYLAAELNGEKFATSKCEITWRKSVSTEIENAEDVLSFCEANYLTDCYTVETKLSKSGLASALKAGKEIPGVTLVEKNNMGVK